MGIVIPKLCEHVTPQSCTCSRAERIASYNYRRKQERADYPLYVASRKTPNYPLPAIPLHVEILDDTVFILEYSPWETVWEWHKHEELNTVGPCCRV